MALGPCKVVSQILSLSPSILPKTVLADDAVSTASAIEFRLFLLNTHRRQISGQRRISGKAFITARNLEHRF